MSPNLFAAVLTLSLAACASSAPATPEPMPAESPPASAAMRCDANKALWAVSQAAGPDLVDKVVKDSGSSISRVVKPGQPMTMDYREDRVSIYVDDKGAVSELSCG